MLQRGIEMKLNDLCENCGVLDGATVNDQKLVCYRCDRKLRKQEKRQRREDVRNNRVRLAQEESA